jgi:hypothetical protein
MLAGKEGRRLLFIAAFVAATGFSCLGQELSIFALEGPGQATVAIDRKRGFAHIVDLGKDGDGDQLKIEGQPLLQRLTELKIQKLVVTCSHPHADHHGGIRAIFREPKNFISPQGKLFPEGIYVAESAMPPAKSLLTLLNGNGAALGIKAKRIDTSAPGGYSAHSSLTDDVFVENIPYTIESSAGIHGRSVITKTVLGGKYTHVDFDDADSHAIASAVATLIDSGVQEIDSFIVPHHGSAYHDLAPIYKLKPKRAIVSVNPSNRYGHPSPEVLAELMEKLGPENVLLTGSSTGERVLIGPEGILHAPHTAAEADSYALFVFPAMARAKGGRTESAKAAYAKIWDMMFHSAGPEPAESNAKSGASGVIGRQIEANGTMLSEDFEAGGARFGFVTPEQSAKARVFASGKPENGVLAIMASATPVPGSPEPRPSGRRLSQTRAQVGRADPIQVAMLNNIGLPDMAQPTREYRVKDLQFPPNTTRTETAASPNQPPGGMVNLTGDKAMMTEDAKILQAGRIDKCGTALCLTTNPEVAGRATSLRLPFTAGTLTAAVWQRTFQQNIDRLYLSINPTKRMLDSGILAESQIPSDRLYYGSGLKPDWRNNRVVTMGEIENSVIGKILWEADVAFKSEALGFDVLTGQRPAVPIPADITREQDERVASTNAALAKSIPRPERWCRLYWESGEQQIGVDPGLSRVQMIGKAVIAHGEAMRVSGSELVPYPNGTWCEDAKAVAARLEMKANASLPTRQLLKDLRDLAEMQTFWRWAREHLVTIAPQLEKELTALAGQDVKQQVPSWTSGVRSSEPVLVQYRRAGGLFQSQILHLRFSEAETIDNCVLPKWRRRAPELRDSGVTRNRQGAFEGKHVFEVTNKWMREFADEIATCAKGTVLTEKVGLNKLLSDEEVESREGEFGLSPHLQPVAIHGGILLGRGSQSLPEVVTQTKALNDPLGRPLFRAQGSTLHFWTTDGDPQSTTLRQHVEVHDAVLQEAYAEDGHLRFLVELKAGSYLKQEARLLVPDAPEKGLEWFGIYDGSDGRAVIEKAASPCQNATGPCNPVSGMTRLKLKDFTESAEDAKRDLITVVPGQDRVWLIDLPIGQVAASLEHLLKPSTKSDLGSSASLAKAYRFWGFADEAEDLEFELRASIREQTETEDLSLGETGSINGMKAALLEFQLLRLAGEFENMAPQAQLGRLASMEKKINRLSLADSNLLWRLFARFCAEMAIPQDAVELNRQKSAMIERSGRRLALSDLLLHGAESGEI